MSTRISNWKIEKFTSVTGVDVATARRCLQQSGNSLDDAFINWFDKPGSASHPTGSRAGQGGQDITRSRAPRPATAPPSATNGTEGLTCSICTSIMYQPVTLSCNHTFCGHCISEWFKSQTACATSDEDWNAGSYNRASPSCPVCRTDITTEPTIDQALSLRVNRYIAAHPNEGKSEEEERDVAQDYTPGQRMLDLERRPSARDGDYSALQQLLDLVSESRTPSSTNLESSDGRRYRLRGSTLARTIDPRRGSRSHSISSDGSSCNISDDLSSIISDDSSSITLDDLSSSLSDDISSSDEELPLPAALRSLGAGRYRSGPPSTSSGWIERPSRRYHRPSDTRRPRNG